MWWGGSSNQQQGDCWCFRTFGDLLYAQAAFFFKSSIISSLIPSFPSVCVCDVCYARFWSSHLAKRGACVPACLRARASPPTWRERERGGEPETELGDKLLYAPLSSCQRTRVIILLKSSAQPLSRTSSRSRCSEATHDAECSRKSRLCLFFSPTTAAPPHRHPSCLFSLAPFLEVFVSRLPVWKLRESDMEAVPGLDSRSVGVNNRLSLPLPLSFFFFFYYSQVHIKKKKRGVRCNPNLSPCTHARTHAGRDFLAVLVPLSVQSRSCGLRTRLCVKVDSDVGRRGGGRG